MAGNARAQCAEETIPSANPYISTSGEIGIRDRLRIYWVTPCRFKSCLVHHRKAALSFLKKRLGAFIVSGENRRKIDSMIKPTRHVYQKSSSGVSGVFWEKDRNKWRAQVCFAQHKHFLGYFDNKEDAIKARIEAEKKYCDPALAGLEKI